ncbi:MAG: hypothetical protein ACMXYM_01665 [Candidatus Woesearchaeota archaeon]
MELLSGLATESLQPMPNALPLAVMLVVLFFGLALYVYYAIALMTIARKIGTPNAWLAFIPVANIYLIWRMSNTPLWTLIIVFAVSATPILGIGGLLVFGEGLDSNAAFLMLMLFALVMILVRITYVGFSSWWWWRVAERRNYHGAFGLLLTLPLLLGMIPYIGFVFGIIPLVGIGILAWRDQP